MDIQYIVDAHACASYVVEYINKSDRGCSSLHKEMIRVMRKNPDKDEHYCINAVSSTGHVVTSYRFLVATAER